MKKESVICIEVVWNNENLSTDITTIFNIIYMYNLWQTPKQRSYQKLEPNFGVGSIG